MIALRLPVLRRVSSLKLCGHGTAAMAQETRETAVEQTGVINWNEARKSRLVELEYLHTLKREFNSNLFEPS